LKTTSHILHPTFRLNGLHYGETDLIDFAKKLEEEGDDHEVSIGKFIGRWLDDTSTIEVRTSGSTGSPKLIQLEKAHMVNSALATGTYFKVGSGTSALLCLSAEYIAGMMMLVRAMVLGWDMHVVAPEKDALTQYDNPYDFVAMVPYQVFHSIEALHKVKQLIIGGGKVSQELSDKLQRIPTEVFETYGMTETITHIAVKRVNGLAKSQLFAALPDVKFSLDSRGCLVIAAPKVSDKEVVTNDLVELHSNTSFTLLGRYDNVVNSGGLKIHPELLEEKIANLIDLPFIIASEADDKFGERIILILEHREQAVVSNYSKALSKLDKYERPKKIYTVSQFPYTETGKIKRADVLQMLKKYKR